MPVGDPYTEVGLKPKLSTRGCVTTGRRAEISPYICANHGLTPWNWLSILSACKTSKPTTSAATAETCLVLADVDFVDIYTWGLGQLKCWAAPLAPTAGKEPQLLQFWDLTSVDLCWWPGENNAWETPGPIASTPMVKVETRTVSNKE